MYKVFFSKIILLALIPLEIIAYDFIYQKDDISIKLDFENYRLI